LFTDLTDSTALYTRVGDAGAFHVVQAHFDLLGSIIDRHRGVIVKTIGDAVMAAFVRQRDAVDAAIQMQRAFPAFRATHPAAASCFLKVGVAAGPCYVVTANGILDYFGHTVNVAARLQGAARAGEIVLENELARAATADGAGDSYVVERFVAELKGLGKPLDAARLVVDRGDRS
jgi:class 3 adenylate cyclase